MWRPVSFKFKVEKWQLALEYGLLILLAFLIF
jgi:hypothetical protein